MSPDEEARMKHSVRRRMAWTALAVSIVVVGCESVQTTRGGAVGVDREQRMIVSAQQVDAAAREQYASVLKESAQKGILNRDSAQAQRVRRIAQRLIPHTAVFRDDAPRWQWEVNVIDSDDVNAWCMPGGKIAVYTGLIEKLAITDDELAAVIGHEIAHALREHARERMSRQMVTQAGATVGAVALEIFTGVRLDPQVAGAFGQAMFVLPNSRENEQESDRIGVELAARAGYDPRAAISLWNKMARIGGGAKVEWLSTHPAHETRIRDLQDYSQRVLPLYEKARGR
jgi:predicted Zn-dependent protease